MKLTPVWKRDRETTSFPILNEHLTADVAIIGGGITGIVLASILSTQGKKVVVLEAMQVSGGTSGSSTGNLYALVDAPLSKIESKYDIETVKTVLSSRSTAIDFIESLITTHNIECEFIRTDWNLFAEDEATEAAVRKEAKTLENAGFPFELTTSLPLPFPIELALKVPGQAQFNPLVFVRALSKKIASDSCKIFERSKVTQLEEDGESYVVKTGSGSVRAEHVVHATHVPKGVDMVQTLLGPYREYAIAAKLNSGSYPYGIFWGLTSGHHHSIRTFKDETGEEFLIILGEPHKVGQMDDNQEKIDKLYDFAKKRFDISEIRYTWGAQHYRPADQLPFIGRRSKDSKIYYSTGYSTDGLVYGTVGAMIIADQIMGKKNAWEKTYDATRITPLKSAGDFIKENINVLAQYIKDLPFIADTSRFSDVKPGEGKVVEEGGQKLAVYRDENGKLDIVSAVCTHMKCIVNFNKLERTWDCPCHGSRFSTCGDVLEGPAITDLSKPKNK